MTLLNALSEIFLKNKEHLEIELVHYQDLGDLAAALFKERKQEIKG